MKKSAMFLLWVGAAISVSEIFTGGLLAPLGLVQGLIVIIIGHIIGTALFAGGACVSYCRKLNAMDSVAFSFGKLGGKLVALCNLVQLMGWIIILVVQAGGAIAGVFPTLPFWTVTLGLSILQIVWAVIFGTPGGRINDVAVVLLAGLCVLFFVESFGYAAGSFSISNNMSIMLGIELSIAMPVSWLPLAGDYSSKANDKIGATLMPFLGYFLGSCFMYIIGLSIVVSNGSDIFAFIASSRFRYVACGIVLLSTITTNFVAIYSAAVSSTKWIKTKNVRTSILVVGIFTLFVSVFFPVSRFELILEKFLTSITMVFVPIFTLVLLEFFMKKQKTEKPINWGQLFIVFIGIAGNWLFNKYSIFIPTVMTALLVSTLFTIKYIVGRTQARGRKNP
ncbi:purine-cytosine permease-like protein [Treponema primitia ZAS-2]|uniref:Purine-cytosine permease-like protein n=2 Tax=Treponema primitia (strain ATCC BAA-887 / DSM 12427 / ZAS-2) TaxID=545694 RepID=F5YMN1_TREPZ|nr:permease [Treponema primitia]AEF84256.1 purine-cytosine permease-like protein [Treponema primitia ZAS-2]